MNRLLLSVIVLFAIWVNVQARKMKTHRFASLYGMQADDALLSVRPIEPKIQGECSCVCCSPAAELRAPDPVDVVLAVDSSACFRDHHSRMTRYMTKLIKRIGRDQELSLVGSGNLRISVLQFSDIIKNPVPFKDSTDGATNKEVTSELTKAVNGLGFIGQGAYLNKALNQSLIQFQNNPRTNASKVIIVLTNGNSHPTVSQRAVQQSVDGLDQAGVTVIPISVTRRCHVQTQDMWVDNMCPDVNVMTKLGKIGRNSNTPFYTMKDSESITDVLDELRGKSIQKVAELNASPCNTCNCTCDLPPGPPGMKGEKGESIKGDKGDQGIQGDTGDRGEKGAVGPQGETGAQGPPGLDGADGKDGSKGEPGERGEVGPQGPVGEQGIKGATGERGVQGEQGEPGERGPKGEEGEMGLAGTRGEQGKTGAQGEKGDRGPAGENGIGIKGEPGREGRRGERGERGFEGPQGPQGAKGSRGGCGIPGENGKPGLPGPTGLDGYDGQKGDMGVQGPRGYPGIQGQQGKDGLNGVNGPAGPRGATGARGPRGQEGEAGPKGEKGEPSTELGPIGLPGPRGPKGESCSDGQDGVDGLQGPQGKSGRPGPPGPPGPPGTLSDEIRSYIRQVVIELFPDKCACNGECEQIEACSCVSDPIDLAFLIDGSESISNEGFSDVKEWIVEMVKSIMPISCEQPINVLLYQFSEVTQMEFSAMICSPSSNMDCFTMDSFRDTLEQVNQMKSGTRTYAGLESVTDTFPSFIRSNSYRILLTLTDGVANDYKNELVLQKAREMFDMMVAVGVGSFNAETLEDFTKSSSYYLVNDFKKLSGLPTTVHETICSFVKKRSEGTEEVIITKSGDFTVTSTADTEEAVLVASEGESSADSPFEVSYKESNEEPSPPTDDEGFGEYSGDILDEE